MTGVECPNCNGTGVIGPFVANIRMTDGAIRGNCDRCAGTGRLQYGDSR